MVLIIGNGALGMGLGAMLARHGHSVRYFGRRGPQAIREARVHGLARSSWSVPAPTKADMPRVELVFVAVKAYSLEAALNQHMGSLGVFAPIISVGNGNILPILFRLRARNPEHLWRLGVCTIACVPEGDNRFRFTNRSPKVSWGPLGPNKAPTRAERRLCQEFPELFEWFEDPFPLFYEKWIFNTALNTLCAGLELPTNGEALKHPLLLRELFEESYDLAARQFEALAPREELFEKFLKLIGDTGGNQNSMARDRSLGRPMETGYLAGLAKDYPGFSLLKRWHRRLETAALGSQKER